MCCHAEGGNTGLLHGTHFPEYFAQQYVVEHARRSVHVPHCDTQMVLLLCCTVPRQWMLMQSKFRVFSKVNTAPPVSLSKSKMPLNLADTVQTMD